MHNKMSTDVKEYYIDKTKDLQKGIERFPSVFLEGVAGSGKTTNVNMFLMNNKDIEGIYIFCEEETEESLIKKICEIKEIINKKRVYVILENISTNGKDIISENAKKEIAFLINHIENDSKLIIISREEPDLLFLKLIWQDKMVVVHQPLFSFEEVKKLSNAYGRILKPGKVFEKTGGFPGVTAMLYKTAQWYYQEWEAGALMHSYEIRAFVHEEIIKTLAENEREVLDAGIMCPWIDVHILKDIWNISGAEIILEKLYRKSMVIYDPAKNIWFLPGFLKLKDYIRSGENGIDEKGIIKNLKETRLYYEGLGDISNALYLINKTCDKKEKQDFIIKHYFEIPYVDSDYKDILEIKDPSVKTMYIQAMYYYKTGDIKAFEHKYKEILKAEVNDKKLKDEIILNLMFVDPSVSIDKWIDHMEGLKGNKYRLYGMLGGSITYLCGFKDVTELFSCSKKDERRKEKIWKEKLGEKEALWYELAKSDYYVETEREQQITADEMLYLKSKDANIRMAVVYILYRAQKLNRKYNFNDYINYVEKYLVFEKDELRIRNMTAIYSIYGEEKLSYNELVEYLRAPSIGNLDNIDECNYIILFMMAKAYIYTGQYYNAEKILKNLIPYLAKYARTRFLLECKFAIAVAYKELGRDKEARREIIEIFSFGGRYRYVEMFSEYGDKGTSLINEYIEIKKVNSVEGFHLKKKYNYGSVLNMPDDDYMERVYKRSYSRQSKLVLISKEDESKENLTMMETLVLQGISRGLTNAQLCDELNLKLSTVKSHIYRLYKKLGVSTRVQALAKAKSMGILEM